MARRALRRARATWSWGVPPDVQRGVGRAGARSGAAEGGRADLRRADARDGDRAVLLDLLDADAVGRAHLRPLRRRPLQRATCGTSSRSSTRRRPRGSRAALYWVLPNLAQFDVKSEVVHGMPVPLGYLAMTGAYAARLHRDAAGDRRRWSSRGGTSSNVTARSPAAVVATVALVARAARGRRPAAGGARARVPARRPRRRTSLYVAVGRRAAAADRARYNALAADVYWIRAIQYYGGTKQRLEHGAASAAPAPPPSIAARPTTRCSIRCSTSRRRSIRGSTSRTGSAPIFLAEPYPGGAGRPDLAIALLEKGLRERPDKWEYMQDIGFVHYWCRHDFRGRGRLVRARRATCRARRGGCARWRRRRWRRAAIGGRRARCGRRFCESAEIDWLRKDAERRLLAAAARSTTIDALQRAVDDYARRDRAAAATGRRSCARGVLRGDPARSRPARRSS